MKKTTFYSFAFTGTVLATGLTLLETPSAQAVTFYTNFADFDAATTTTLVEDFEAVFPKNTNFPSFVSNGNTYTGITSTGGAFPNVNVLPAGTTNFSVPVITSSVLAASGDEDFRVDFGTPAEAVAFDTYLNVFGPATVRVFGSSGLLDTFSLTHDPTTVGFLGMTSTELITAIQWTSPNGTITNTGIDNIRLGDIIDSEPVPEPTSILSLLVLGTLGGRSILKRRSQG